MTTRKPSGAHRKPCPTCGRSAHAGERFEFVVATIFNAGADALCRLFLIPKYDPAHDAS